MVYLWSKKRRDASTSGRGGTVVDWSAEFEKLAAGARDSRLQRYYQAGMVGGDTPLAEVPLVAMDFETTGLDKQRDGIVSIGLVPMQLMRIHCAQAQQWVLRPREELSGASVAVHGITHSRVADAPDLDRIIDELLGHLAGRVVVVHHRGIERGFLDAALRLRIGEGICFPVIDTLELEARLHRQRQLSLWDRLRGRKPVSLRLGESRTRYHLPFYRPHEALTDALACAELLQAQVADRYSPTSPIAELWC